MVKKPVKKPAPIPCDQLLQTRKIKLDGEGQVGQGKLGLGMMGQGQITQGQMGPGGGMTGLGGQWQTVQGQGGQAGQGGQGGQGGEGQTVAEALNFLKMSCEGDLPRLKKKAYDGPSVADELNARLAMLQTRPNRCKAIRRLVHTRIVEPPHTFKFICVCPQYDPCYMPCQHTGQIIIDRDVLTREEHLCFLATPRKDISAPRKAPRVFHKKIYRSNCTARVEKLAEPDLVRVKETMRNYKSILGPRNIKALQTALLPKPPVESMTLERAFEYMEEELRLRQVARQLHRRRCKSLKKRILQRQRKQMRKIVCVLFEEMKDFLLNDQFIIDESSPLCAVILERIKDFTDQEFYTTSNLREYQRILANNLTVWINKFISNLNIYLAPQQIPVKREMLADENPEMFVPLSDYISVSDNDNEMIDDYLEGGLEEDDLYNIYNDEDLLTDVLANQEAQEKIPSEETLVNA